MDKIRLEEILERAGIGGVDEKDAAGAHCKVKHNYHAVDSIADATTLVLAIAFIYQERSAFADTKSTISIGLYRRSVKINIVGEPVRPRRH